MSIVIDSTQLTHKIDVNGNVHYYTDDIIINTTRYEIKLINHTIGKTLNFSVTDKPHEYSEAFLIDNERSVINASNKKYKLCNISLDFNILFKILENKLFVFRIDTIEKPYFKILTYITTQMVITCYNLDTFEKIGADITVDEISNFELLHYNSGCVMMQLYNESYQSKVILFDLLSMNINEFPKCVDVVEYDGNYSDYAIIFNSDTKTLTIHDLTKQFDANDFIHVKISNVVNYEFLQNYPSSKESTRSLLITTTTRSLMVHININ
jgi:hypothetical protein